MDKMLDRDISLLPMVLAWVSLVCGIAGVVLAKVFGLKEPGDVFICMAVWTGLVSASIAIGLFLNEVRKDLK